MIEIPNREEEILGEVVESEPEHPSDDCFADEIADSSLDLFQLVPGPSNSSLDLPTRPWNLQLVPGPSNSSLDLNMYV